MSRRSQAQQRDYYGNDSAGDTHYPGTGILISWDEVTVIDRADTTAGAITPYDFNAIFTTTSGEAIYYGAGTLPIGLVVDHATGIVSGTPTVVGTYRVGLSGRDSTGQAVSNNFNWVIT